MEELMIVDLQKTDITEIDFDRVKMQLEDYLKIYDQMVFTEENVADASKTATYLNSQIKALDTALKAYRDKCLEPYNAIASKVKELSSMIEEQRQRIKQIPDDYSAKLEEENAKKVRAFYDKKSVVLGEYADRLYDKLVDPKYYKKSNFSKHEEPVLLAITKASDDIETIRTWGSRATDRVIEVYVETLSTEEAKKKYDEIESISKDMGLVTTESNVEVKIDSPAKKEEQVDSNGTAIKIYGNERQLKEIFDFMKMIGVQYEQL